MSYNSDYWFSMQDNYNQNNIGVDDEESSAASHHTYNMVVCYYNLTDYTYSLHLCACPLTFVGFN